MRKKNLIILIFIILIVIFFIGPFIDRSINFLIRGDKSCKNDADTTFGPVGCEPCEEDAINKNYRPFCFFTRVSFSGFLMNYASFRCEDLGPHYSICRDGVASQPSNIEEFFRACNKLTYISENYYESKYVCFRDVTCYIAKNNPHLAIEWCNNATLLLKEDLEKQTGGSVFYADCFNKAIRELAKVDLEKALTVCESEYELVNRGAGGDYNICILEIATAVGKVNQSKANQICEERIADFSDWKEDCFYSAKTGRNLLFAACTNNN